MLDAERWSQVLAVASVSATHTSLPNHWLSFAIVGRAQSWTLARTLAVTVLGAAGHVCSTLLVSLLVAASARVLFSERAYERLSSALLVLVGAAYLSVHVRRRSSGTAREGGGCARRRRRGGPWPRAARGKQQHSAEAVYQALSCDAAKRDDADGDVDDGEGEGEGAKEAEEGAEEETGDDRGGAESDIEHGRAGGDASSCGHTHLHAFVAKQLRAALPERAAPSTRDDDDGGVVDISGSGGGGALDMASGNRNRTAAGMSHRAAVIALILLPTLSPCLGSMPVLLKAWHSVRQGAHEPPASMVTTAATLPPPPSSVQMASQQLDGRGDGSVAYAFILLVTLLVVTAAVMCTLVALSFLGAKRLTVMSNFARRHDNLIVGCCLLALGVLSAAFDTRAHHHHHYGNLDGGGRDGQQRRADYSRGGATVPL